MLERDRAGTDVPAIMTAAVDACEPAAGGAVGIASSLMWSHLTTAEEASIQHLLMYAGIVKQAACLLPEIPTAALARYLMCPMCPCHPACWSLLVVRSDLGARFPRQAPRAW